VLNIFGRFIKSQCIQPRLVDDSELDARIITDQQLRDRDVRVGDLVLFVGGCPRVPGDRCDLVGGYKSVICEYGGELYYKVIS
jgi:hypothetical protein